MIIKQHADLSFEYFQLSKEIQRILPIKRNHAFNVLTFSYFKEERNYEVDKFQELMFDLKQKVSKEKAQLIISQEEQINSLNRLKKNKDEFESLVKEKFLKLK